MKGYRPSAGGILVPESLAKKIGIGCPKCDEHFLQDAKLGQVNPDAQKFIHKHMSCGQLDALELQGGKLVCTGPVMLKMMQ